MEWDHIWADCEQIVSAITPSVSWYTLVFNWCSKETSISFPNFSLPWEHFLCIVLKISGESLQWALWCLKSLAAQPFFFSSLFSKHQSSTLLNLSEGNPPVTNGFPSQRPSNGESVSLSWSHHGCVGWKSSNMQLSPWTKSVRWGIALVSVCISVSPSVSVCGVVPGIALVSVCISVSPPVSVCGVVPGIALVSVCISVSPSVSVGWFQA